MGDLTKGVGIVVMLLGAAWLYFAYEGARLEGAGLPEALALAASPLAVIVGGFVVVAFGVLLDRLLLIQRAAERIARSAEPQPATPPPTRRRFPD